MIKKKKTKDIIEISKQLKLGNCLSARWVLLFAFLVGKIWCIPFVNNSEGIWIDFTAFCYFSWPVETSDERCLDCRFQFYPLSSIFFSLDYDMTPVIFQRSVLKSHLEEKFCIHESKTILLTQNIDILPSSIQLFAGWGIWGNFWSLFPFNLITHPLIMFITKLGWCCVFYL